MVCNIEFIMMMDGSFPPNHRLKYKFYLMEGYLIKYSFEFKELDQVVKDGEENDHEDVDKAVQHTAL